MVVVLHDSYDEAVSYAMEVANFDGLYVKLWPHNGRWVTAESETEFEIDENSAAEVFIP